MDELFQTIIIFKPLSPETIQELNNKYENIIQKYSKTKKARINPLGGERKLAYVIQHYKYGVYLDILYVGRRENIRELESIMKKDDSILKFITIKSEEDIDLLEDLPKIIDVYYDILLKTKRIEVNKDAK